MSKLKRAKSLIWKTIKFRDEVRYHSGEMLVIGLRFANKADYCERKIILIVERNDSRFGDKKDEVEYTDRRFKIING